MIGTSKEGDTPWQLVLVTSLVCERVCALWLVKGKLTTLVVPNFVLPNKGVMSLSSQIKTLMQPNPECGAQCQKHQQRVPQKATYASF